MNPPIILNIMEYNCVLDLINRICMGTIGGGIMKASLSERLKRAHPYFHVVVTVNQSGSV